MENHIKIQTGRSLSSAIDLIMKESIDSSRRGQLQANATKEKEKQAAAMLDEEDDDLEVDKSSGNEESASEKKSDISTSSKTIDAEKDKLKKGDIKASDIVSKLNTIRAGKSFKDSAIATKMEEYIESLSMPEKVALLAFLKGITQIVTGEVESTEVMDPSDNPADVSMEKGNELHKKIIKPIIIKAPAKEKSTKTPSAEDTSGPVPITPKR